MSNSLVIKKENLPAMAMDETELMNVLRNSLYPGAQDESIKLVISYCKASGLDPMQKPVHIVPMYTSTGKKDAKGYDIKAMRDVVMPGIGLYRTQAARSGQYAGVSEPEFGDDVTEGLGDAKVTYPKWCKVIVMRQMENGTIVEFSAKEIWKENYATKGKDSATPNSMWLKRPYGQIAKCAEAQALRKAFPEFGSQPTADEMEGKTYDDGATTYVNTKVTPASAAALSIADGYEDYEIEQLPLLEAVAKNGSKALESAFKSLDKSQHKAALWTKHSVELKETAASSDFVIDIEKVEVIK
jgi:phage recombination protein Bet